MTPEALQRQTRACVARDLLRLHSEEQLENSEQWTWEQLSLVPRWCIYGVDQRAQLQRVCGVIVMAPSIARWINGQLIREVHALVGAGLVETLLVEAWEYKEVEARADICTMESSEVVSQSTPQLPIEVDAYLMHSGAAVLRASLDPSLPVNKLAASLPVSGMNVSHELANAIINRAEAILETSTGCNPQGEVA